MASLKNINFGKNDLPNIEDAFDVLDKSLLEQEGGAEIRIMGPFYEMHYHTFKGVSSSGKDFFGIVPCINWSLSKQEKQECNCPYCEAGVGITRKFYVNALCLNILDNNLLKNSLENRTASEKEVKSLIDDFKCFCKDPKSQTYTPVRVLSLTSGTLRKLKAVEDALFDRKADGTKVYLTLDDLQYGPVLQYRFNNSSGIAPGERYSIQKLDRFPITKEIRKMALMYDIGLGEKLYPTYDELLAKLKKDASKLVDVGDGIKKFITPESNKGYHKSASNVPTVSTADVDDIDVEIEAPKNALDNASIDASELDDEIPF